MKVQGEGENSLKSDSESGDRDDDDDDYDDDEFPPVHIKLPLQLDLDDIAGVRILCISISYIVFTPFSKISAFRYHWLYILDIAYTSPKSI